MTTKTDPDGQSDIEHNNVFGLKRYLLNTIYTFKREIAKAERLIRARCDLQAMWNVGLKTRDLKKVGDVMHMIDEQQMVLRREAVLEAGKKDGAKRTKLLSKKFEGREMGSFELMIYYDGVTKTRPGFQNPYRTKYGKAD